MIAFALLLLAASQQVEVVNERFEIPPGKWHQVGLGLRQSGPVVILADFETDSGSPPMRLELVRREELDRHMEGRPNSFLAMTPTAATGKLRYWVRMPGYYVVFLDNRKGKLPVSGRLLVQLDFSGRGEPTVRTLSPLRQLTVILISFAVFFTIVTYSARRLLRSIKR